MIKSIREGGKKMQEFYELKKEFVEYLQFSGKVKKTIKRHEVNLRDFFKFLEERKIKDIYEIKYNDLIEYQKYRKSIRGSHGKENSADHNNRFTATVKKFFEFLKRQGYLVYDPASDIEYSKVPQRLPKTALSYKDFKKIVKQIDINSLTGYRDRTILEVLFSSALRRQELINIKLKDIDYENGFVRVIGKGDKERMVPVGKIACQYVENYIVGVRPFFKKSKNNDKLFLSIQGCGISETALWTLINKYVTLAKLSQNISAHSFRRGAATGMIRNNAHIMLVRDMLGHNGMEAIKSYVDLTIVDLKKAHKKTHPREK